MFTWKNGLSKKQKKLSKKHNDKTKKKAKKNQNNTKKTKKKGEDEAGLHVAFLET